MMPRKIFASLFLMYVAAPILSANSLQCYSGVGRNYHAVDCYQCQDGVDCLCMIIQRNGPEQTERGCWANPYGVQQPGCFQRIDGNGQTANICTCKENLCNGGEAALGQRPLALLMAIVAAAIVTTVS